MIQSGTPIRVTFSLDNICAPCPHHNGRVCQQQSFIEDLDTRHAKALGLYGGETLTWEEALGRIKNAITVDIFHKICAGCSWKEWGVCEKSLINLREESDK